MTKQNFSVGLGFVEESTVVQASYASSWPWPLGCPRGLRLACQKMRLVLEVREGGAREGGLRLQGAAWNQALLLCSKQTNNLQSTSVP